MINLKLILRSIWKKRFTNSINLIGIIIGLSVSSLILIYAKNEFNANNFFPDLDRVYRLESNWGNSNSLKQVNLLNSQVAEIEAATSYQGSWSFIDLVQHNDKNIKIEHVIYADSLFFDVLQFHALHGDLHSALDAKNSIVISKKQALRIFNKTNCLNEQLKFNTSNFGVEHYTITAVLDDFPDNCSFNFDVALSLSTLLAKEGYGANADHWGTCNYSTFVKLAKNANVKSVQEKMDEAIKQHAPEWVHDVAPFYLNPLNGLNFNSPDGDGEFKTSSKATVIILSAIGLLIMLLAGINYFNLNIAQIESNINDIGIRKTVGASNYNIAMQAMTSTFILFAIAIVFSLLVVHFMLPIFNNFTNSTISFGTFISGKNLAFIIGSVFISCLLFGLFPALFTVKQKPISVLANKTGNSKTWVKNSLLIFQFFIAIVLIASTIMLNKQNHFLLNTDYGYNRENILYIPLSPEAKENYKMLEQVYEKDPMVNEVAFGNGLFGNIGSNWGRNLIYEGKNIDVEFDVMRVSYDFFKLFNLEIIEGEYFSENSVEQSHMIYNEAFVKKYQLENPLNSFLEPSHPKYETIGIVKNFNHGSLHNQISPLGFQCIGERFGMLFVSFKSSNPAQIKESIAKMEEKWNEVSPNFPFESHFFDKHYEDIYESELKMMKVLSAASILAILIAALGLFCIAYFIINKRINEIGIRKVNGASITEVVQLLNIDIVRWVVVAIMLSIPSSYLILDKWLENFAYKTELSWWIFVLAGASALFIALLTVSWQTFKAARQNPVEALRYE